MARARIVLADDHTLLLDAVEKLFPPEFEIVGKAEDGRALVELARQTRPDAVVLDMMMPGLNGLDAARQMRRVQPGLGLVFLTMVDDPAVAAQAIRLRPCAYVLKRSAASELVSALRDVLRGRSYVTPLIMAGVAEALERPAGGDGVPPSLTSRQREVLQLLAEGRSMKEIGAILHITPRTVAFHKYRMMEQLQITSTAQLIQFAVRERLVS
jgi:DNA-binding NarL/FixJ family response regulator